MYKISIIYLNYNQEQYIKTSLEAILNQTFSPFEIIIIDDCSSDNSVKLLKEYEKRNSNIKLIVNEVNKGAAWVSNCGVENSKGDLIYIAAADDIVKINLLEEANSAFASNKNLGMFSARIDVINRKGEYILNKENKLIVKEGLTLLSPTESYRRIFNNDYWVTGQTAIYKKDLLIKHKLNHYEDLRAYMDHLLIYNIIFRYNSAFSNKVLATWRLIEGSYSDTNLKLINSLPALYNFKKQLINTLTNVPKNKKIVKVIIKNYTNNLRILHFNAKIIEINKILKSSKLNNKNSFYFLLLNLFKILLYLYIFLLKIRKLIKKKLNLYFISMKIIRKIYNHHRLQRLIRLPIFLIYEFNFFIINFFRKKYVGLLDKKIFIEKIKIDDAFKKMVSLDLEKKDHNFFGKSKNYLKYLYYSYPIKYLDEVNFAWSINRKSYIDFLDLHFGKTIRKIYNGHNYRVEHIFLHETKNIDNKETYNMNSNFHHDADMPGAIKILIYLTDVDKDNGPFAYKDSSNLDIKYVLGEVGTSIVFIQNKLLHAGSNTKLKKRISLSYLIYPTLRKEIMYTNYKPLNCLCSINPFTKST